MKRHRAPPAAASNPALRAVAGETRVAITGFRYHP